MDVLFRLGRATAAEVMAEIPGNSSYSTVRTQLRVLERKGYVRHQDDGVRFIYSPVATRHAARKSALRHLVNTFFEGSTTQVVEALLGESARLSDDQLDRLAELIARARKEESR